jgi:hypothetical protein
MVRTLFLGSMVSFLLTGFSLTADDKVFSGPQVGEKLSSFKVRGVFDNDAGVELDFVAKANGKPILLIFVHDFNRQSLGFTRTLSQYTHQRSKDGLTTGVVWLDDDATEAETKLKRSRHGLAPDVPIGIFLDGIEGPGSYGLNRKVMLTILVGNEDKVTANFALVQPSLKSDLPQVLESVVALIGGSVPKLEELMKTPEGMQPGPSRDAATNQAPNLRPYLAPVIQLKATPEEVDKAAKELVEVVEKDAAARKELGRIASTIVGSGKLDNYGTPRAREWLAEWAKQYGTKSDEKIDAPNAPKERR